MQGHFVICVVKMYSCTFLTKFLNKFHKIYIATITLVVVCETYSFPVQINYFLHYQNPAIEFYNTQEKAKKVQHTRKSEEIWLVLIYSATSLPFLQFIRCLCFYVLVEFTFKSIENSKQKNLSVWNQGYYWSLDYYDDEPL